ncbi:MAG: HAD family hydrolase [Treponema sp.]|jgi:FMN phosphatase YigB (HAD superfamily)|nr:HAD family hydrolase [Treponema sp.]
MTKFPSEVNRVYITNAPGGQAANEEIPPSKLLHNIRGIIFDFDGTLFDNARIPFHLIAAYPPDMLRIRNERLIRKNFGGCDYSSPEEYYNAFFTALAKVCLSSPQRIRDWYYNRYMPRMVYVLKKHYKPRPGVRELFARLNLSTEKNLPMAAVYSDYPFLRERLEALGLYPAKRISLYGPESFGAQKPAVRPFRQIAENMGVAPEEVLVIGDREDTDGLGAFHAGMRFFCLETGRRRYFRLDPNRRYEEEQPRGPSLVMYTSVWDNLIKLLLDQTAAGISKANTAAV